MDTFTNIKLIWARSFPRREGPEGIVRQTYLPSTSYYTVVEGPVPACTSRPLQRFHPPHILVALVCMLGTKTYIELTRAYIPSTGHATSVDIAGMPFKPTSTLSRHFIGRRQLLQRETFCLTCAIEAADRKVDFSHHTECRSIEDVLLHPLPHILLTDVQSLSQDTVRIFSKNVKAKKSVAMY